MTKWIIYDPFVCSDAHVVSIHKTKREAENELRRLLRDPEFDYTGCLIEPKDDGATT